VLVSIQNGNLPRFIARVSPSNNFDRGTFANPNRPFAFAAEPADLRGISQAEAMYKVDWTREWIEPNIGKEIVIAVLDTDAREASVPSRVANKDNHCMVELGVATGKASTPVLSPDAIKRHSARPQGSDADVRYLYNHACRAAMKNLWIQTEHPFATWVANLDALRDEPTKLLQLVDYVLGSGEKHKVFEVVEAPAIAFRAAPGQDLSGRLHGLYRDQQIADLFGFTGAAMAPRAPGSSTARATPLLVR
jgi:hypothetical protein